MIMSSFLEEAERPEAGIEDDVPPDAAKEAGRGKDVLVAIVEKLAGESAFEAAFSLCPTWSEAKCHERLCELVAIALQSSETKVKGHALSLLLLRHCGSDNLCVDVVRALVQHGGADDAIICKEHYQKRNILKKSRVFSGLYRRGIIVR